jgi:hypothetical protein
VADRVDATVSAAFRASGLSMQDLWLRFVGLGGAAPPDTLQRYLAGAAIPRGDHNMLVHALNERIMEMGGDHPLAYPTA